MCFWQAQREYPRPPVFLQDAHAAWASAEAIQALADQLIDNIEAFVCGTPVNVVAPKA